MKKILFIVLGLLISSSTRGFSVRDFLFPTYQTGGNTIILDRLKGIYLIKPTQRELIFNAKGQTARDLASTLDPSNVVVNAGYFGRGSQGFFPAGHFSYDPIMIDTAFCDRDPNLCGYVFTTDLSIHENITFTKEPTFAAGPVMMLSGVVNKSIQNNISHRTQKRYRTLLITTNKGPFFVVTKKQYALDRLLAYMVKTFGRDISVINLDGGSSTALRSDNPSFQVNGDKHLPTFFILK